MDFDITESHIYRQAYFHRLSALYVALGTTVQMSLKHFWSNKQNYVFSCFEHSMLNT